MQRCRQDRTGARSQAGLQNRLRRGAKEELRQGPQEVLQDRHRAR